jgi:hypothetical protein
MENANDWMLAARKPSYAPEAVAWGQSPGKVDVSRET